MITFFCGVLSTGAAFLAVYGTYVTPDPADRGVLLLLAWLSGGAAVAGLFHHAVDGVSDALQALRKALEDDKQ